MTENHVSFETALKVLELSLKGLKPKQIQFELKCSHSTISDAKAKFPLFLGLRRKKNLTEDTD